MSECDDLRLAMKLMDLAYRQAAKDRDAALTRVNVLETALTWAADGTDDPCASSTAFDALKEKQDDE